MLLKYHPTALATYGLLAFAAALLMLGGGLVIHGIATMAKERRKPK